jgi:hypothetical protein
MVMINHSFPQFSILVATIAGISIYTSDVYFIILCAILIFSYDENKFCLSKKHLLFFLYIAIAFISLVNGVLSNRFSPDLVGDIRKFSTIIITVIYFSKYPIKMNRINLKLLTITMRCILTYCWICWISALVFGVYLTPNGTLRCIGSDYAFILSVYTVWLIYRDLMQSRKRRVSIESLLYIVSIIILQHNTVYMTLAIGLFTLLWLERKELFAKHNMWILQVMCILIIGVAVLSQIPNSPLVEVINLTMDKFSQALSTSSGSEEGTIGTRYIVWKGLIDTLNSPLDWMFGKSMGTGYHVPYLNGTWQASPHSGYIQGLMRVGLVGMMFLIGQILYDFVQHIRKGETLFAAFLIMILVYWYSYSYTSEIGFMIGMSMAMVNNLVYVEEEDACYEKTFERLDFG